MKFLQKRWVAAVLCIIMIAIAIGIRANHNRAEEYRPDSSSAAENWGNENYESFLQFVYDNGTLTDSTIRKISEYNAALEYTYGSICAVAVEELLDGETMEDAAEKTADRMQLGSMDCLLLLDPVREDWFFLYNDELSFYVDRDLEILVRGEMNDAFADLNRSIPDYFEKLEDWYEDQVPLASESNAVGERVSAATGGFVALLFVFILLIVLISSASRTRGRWTYRAGPVFRFGVPRLHRTVWNRPPHGPGPHSMHGSTPPRPPFGRSTGRSGGFGGTGRSGGFRGSHGGKRGGFGK